LESSLQQLWFIYTEWHKSNADSRNGKFQSLTNRALFASLASYWGRNRSTALHTGL